MKNLKLLLILTIALIFCYRSSGQTSTPKEELAKARELVQQGNTTEASKVYMDIMGKYPGNKEAVQGWIMINMKRGPTGEQDALGQLDELRKQYPDNTAILFWKMFLLMELQRTDEALQIADKLVTVQPDSAINWLGRGQILEFQNKNDEALVSYEKATSLDPKSADAWQNKAGLLAKKGRLDEAIESYNKAIELSPKIPVFIYNRGCAYCRKGDNVNALADLEKAISMNPQFKSYAQKDVDFKSLWDNEEFKKLTAE